MAEKANMSSAMLVLASWLDTALEATHGVSCFRMMKAPYSVTSRVMFRAP